MDDLFLKHLLSVFARYNTLTKGKNVLFPVGLPEYDQDILILRSLVGYKYRLAVTINCNNVRTFTDYGSIN